MTPSGYDGCMADELAALLRPTPLFRKVGPEDLDRVAQVSRSVSYKRNERIFDEGDGSDELPVIVRGRVKIFKTTPGGKDVILEIFGPGDPLGAVAVYERRPYPASAVALDDTVCVMVPRDAFFVLLEQYPSLVRGLLLGLTQRLVELTNRIAELTGGRLEPRFARLFLKMADEAGRSERNGIFIPMALSRQELADLTGTTIETCIRIMSRWGKQQIVTTEKDGFVVLDRRTLETLALA
jgi:CRP/FNR family transcriptional regulator, nitrogen oxide reductase regulator